MVKNKAYEFCIKNIDLETTPKYVKLQMRDFINLCEGKNEKYELNYKKLNQLEGILRLLIMPKEF